MRSFNIENYVDIYRQENIRKIFSEDNETYKTRLIIGLKVTGMECYLFKKIGSLFVISEEEKRNGKNIFEKYKQHAIDVAKESWHKIIGNDEWKIFELPLFGYHFGMDYRIDDQGQILGEWPIVATMRINCEAIFPIKSGLILPDEFSNLKLFPLPKPTGKQIQ